MSLLALRQSAFLAAIHDDAATLPAGWGARQAAGMEIYRNNYRVALVEALKDTFERTARWVGEDAFRQAAAHHVIVNPPTSWTLDEAGDGFAETLAELFAGDPEVAELGWVEEAMHRVFSGEDAAPLNAAGFAEATGAFAAEDWEGLRLTFMPRIATRLVRHDVAAIWQTLGEDRPTVPDHALARPIARPMACHVYREGEQPVFVLAPAHEAEGLSAMQRGATFGQLCALLTEQFEPDAAAAEAGSMLGRWLHMGLIRALT